MNSDTIFFEYWYFQLA